jgi:hypothetical protein
MTVETVTVDPELARRALGDVLDADAAAQPAAAPPPRRQPPPDATPEAPWGFNKKTGKPNKGPAGPGRPPKDTAAAARTEEPSTPAQTPVNSQPGTAVAEQRSYAQEVSDALTIGWMMLASLPPTKPQAYVLHEGMGNLVPAWDQAARQNPTVRKYVLKISGEGSWAWVIPVAISTLPVVLGMWQALSLDKEQRAELTAATDAHLKEFVLEQAKAAGLQVPEEPAAEPGAAPPARAA